MKGRGRRALAAWMERSHTRRCELAAALHVSRPYVSQLLLGERRPGLELGIRIEALTGVHIALWADSTVSDLVEAVSEAAQKWQS